MVIIIGWGPGPLPNQTYQIQSTKPNPPNQSTKQNPQNQTYQTKTNLPNQTKPDIIYQIVILTYK